MRYALLVLALAAAAAPAACAGDMNQPGTGVGTTVSASTAAFGRPPTVSTFTADGSLAMAGSSSITIPAGSSGMRAMVGGIIYSKDYTQVQTTTTFNTDEINFATITITGNTLRRQGDCIRVTANYRGGANTNTKNAKVRWASTSGVLMAQQSMSASGGATTNIATVCRGNASNQQYFGGIGAVGSGGGGGTGIAGSDLTTDLPIYVGCASATGTQGDCSFLNAVAEFLPAP